MKAASTVRPVDAAGLVLIRQGRGEPEVLMGRRHRGHSFLPNIYVFPGGRLDIGDNQPSGFPEPVPGATLRELPKDAAGSKRVGDYAAKRKFPVGYHAHTQASLTAWDEALAQSKYNAINLDAGHYVAGTSQSPIPLIEKHHARIVSMHLKDRKKADGPNLPWGQGDTPLVEILQLMKSKKLKFPATIELEYPVPEGSTRVAEIGKCLEFCRHALAGATTTAAR